METCPALRPRWCPEHSPWRIQDCCLPATAYRRLSLATALRIILWTTTLHISGLHHTAYILVPSSFALPLLGVHVDFTTDLLARLWSGGTCTLSVRTHWVTTTHFMGFLPIPRFRAYLGTSSAWLALLAPRPVVIPHAIPSVTKRCSPALSGSSRVRAKSSSKTVTASVKLAPWAARFAAALAGSHS